MFKQLVLFFLLLFTILIPRSQNRHQLPDYLAIYKSAEKFYNSENPTAKTDSLALLSYLKIISLPEKQGINKGLLFDSYLKAGILEMSAKNDEKAIALFSGSIAV